MLEGKYRELTEGLLKVYSDRKPIDPPNEWFSQLDVADAYAIQLAQVDRWCEDGAVVKGHKVGLTSVSMQRQLGVSQPDFGHLTDRMFRPDGQTIKFVRFIQPKIEPEIALVLGRPLYGPGVTVSDAIAALEFVLPCLEIIDSRVRNWDITLPDTIADNASSGGVVLGGTPTKPSDVDLRLTGGVLSRNGDIFATGAGGAVLGSPINALVWLANTLGEREIGLKAGNVVLPGSITTAVPAEPGDVMTATFDRLGTVSAHFDASS